VKRRRSLVGHILISNFKIIITAVVLIVIVLIISLCNMCRNTHINEAKTQLSESAHALKFEIESALQQTDILVRNEYIMEGLDTEFTRNHKLIGFLDDLTSFVGGLEETEIWEIDRFIIYSENPTLVNSGYVRSASALRSFDDIREATEPGMQYFRWKDSIGTDERGREYLTLYRYIPMKYDCIAELKVFVDSVMPTDNIYNISLVPADSHYTVDSLHFSEALIDGFVLTGGVERDVLYKQYALYFFYLVLCAAAFLIVTFLLAERSVNKAMKDILGLIADIRSGDIMTDKGPERWNELAVIKNKISELTNKLNEISVREYKHELTRRKLEVEVLTSKINPHMLYNSLSAIKLAAFKEKSFEIAEVADVLIDYYRLVLNRGEDTISVVKELEYLEKYIEIYKISKKTDYEVDFYVSNDAIDLELPHMLLQPILENALIHGLNSTKDKHIIISAHCDGEKIIIDISDNGVGIEQDELVRLNNRECLGYGLNSVIQRADFYYDGDFDFHIESEVGKGTKATLIVTKEIKRIM